MKQLTYVFLAMLLLSLFGCRRNRADRQYERYLEDTAKIEFITPPEDSVVLEDAIVLLFVVIAVISLVVYNLMPSIKNEEDFR